MPPDSRRPPGSSDELASLGLDSGPRRPAESQIQAKKGSEVRPHRSFRTELYSLSDWHQIPVRPRLGRGKKAGRCADIGTSASRLTRADPLCGRHDLSKREPGDQLALTRWRRDGGGIDPPEAASPVLPVSGA